MSTNDPTRRTAQHRTQPDVRRRVLLAVGMLVSLSVLAFAAMAVRAYLSIERIPFAPEEAQASLDERSLGSVEELTRDPQTFAGELWDVELPDVREETRLIEDKVAELRGAEPQLVLDTVFSPPLPDEMFDAYLAVGADLSGYLADTIMLGLVPKDGSAPILVSIPRDLYVMNPCRETYTRINQGLGGCRGFASGPELLSLMVEGFTGIEIDHFAIVNFDGFMRVVDALGGIELCSEYDLRDWRAGLDFKAGCRVADGATALAWVRSRHTEAFIDGEWKLIASSDFERQRKQQDFLFKIADKLASFDSLTNLVEVMSSAASAVKLDAGFSFTDALALAWNYRGIDPSQVRRFSLSVRDYTTAAGAQVLLPTKTFNEQLAEVYPPAAR